MGVAGSISPPGGAPKPDPERVATIRYTIVDEPETCAAFGESIRANLASLNERTLAETRTGDLGECSLLLDHVHDRVAGLDPARLQPRTGLAGLFDSRSKRLKTFRAAYASAAAAVAQSAADIGDRAGALSRKGVALETLWSETRDAIAELDAHIAAARGWLANEVAAATVVAIDAPEPVEETPSAADEDPTPVEAAADPEATAEGEIIEPTSEAEPVDLPAAEVESEVASVPAEDAAPVETGPDAVEAQATPPAEDEVVAVSAAPAPQPTPVATLPHPLATRLAALEAVSATAIGRLPLLRAAQNADSRVPAALKHICDGIEAWRIDWQDALGLAVKRPKTIRPDGVRLSEASTALTDRIQSANRELAAAQARRAELEARTTQARANVSLAA
ncbi:toxic anion resistance protein [Brevundimonas sp. NIBR11]|uniref:toxic anion resistance protein n=1 Tax=Brevundimonas sp. NIBR11 TaxID=3015999 RepID=UPI0022F138B9|nr:toxic anion resistance protein [Brevundimonas sp. NIBR11]WGM30467.1 hypothetical protein KKHFBJBL_00691 [Brevundimonas sp. NIBR11]